MKLSIILLVFSIIVLIGVIHAVPLNQYRFVYTKNDDVSDPVKWSNCSKAGDPATLLNVVFSPDPPKKGKPVQVTATVILKENVTGGDIKVDLKVGVLPGISQKFDLCKAAGKCPIQASSEPQQVTISDTIPSIAPSGHYEGNVEVTDEKGNELVCISLDMHL